MLDKDIPGALDTGTAASVFTEVDLNGVAVGVNYAVVASHNSVDDT